MKKSSIVIISSIQEHIDAFSNWDGTINDTGEGLTRQACFINESLSHGQKNAIILWLSELEEKVAKKSTIGK